MPSSTELFLGRFQQQQRAAAFSLADRITWPGSMLSGDLK